MSREYKNMLILDVDVNIQYVDLHPKHPCCVSKLKSLVTHKHSADSNNAL